MKELGLFPLIIYGSFLCPYLSLYDSKKKKKQKDNLIALYEYAFMLLIKFLHE